MKTSVTCKFNMKMNVRLSLLLGLSLLIHTANAFNITKMLEKFPDYSMFNNYLTETKLASEINSRKTITILAVDNGNMGSLSGKSSPSLLKNILSIHVILDYYDMPKLQKLSEDSVLLTTLFQSSGVARNHQGFVNVTKLGSNNIAMGSAVPGAPLGSSLVKPIVAQPYDISVLQVSNVIVPPGIENTTATPAKAPAPSRARAPKKSVAPAPESEESPVADEPSPADAPADDDTPAADKETSKSKSGAPAVQVGLAVVVTMVLSSLYLASRCS